MSITNDPRERAAKAARNQSLFRDINERIKELNEGFSLVIPVGEWVCECANDTCVERLLLSAEEYEAVRREPTHFFVAPDEDHIWPQVERVVERRERYWLVEKVGEA